MSERDTERWKKKSKKEGSLTHPYRIKFNIQAGFEIFVSSLCLCINV